MKALWPTVRLGEVVRQRDSAVPVGELDRVNLAGIYSFARGLFKRGPIEPAKTSYKSYNRLRANDFVMSMPKAWEGALARVTPEFDGWFLSPVFPTFRTDAERLLPEYLEWYCKREKVWEELQRRSRGLGARRESVHPSEFLALEIPLPPVTEQRTTVKKLASVARKLEHAIELHQEAKREAEALVRSYLNQLFGDYYNGTAGLLGVKRWEKLGAVVTDVADGPHVTPQYVSEGIPFITVLNITSGRIQFGNHKFITPEDHAQFQRRAKAEPGDVLLSKDGTIGVPCLVDTDRSFSFFVSVALIKPDRTVLDGEFLTWVIRAPYLQERIVERSRGDMIRHLVLREIRDLTIPVPELVEQRRIVAKLNEVQAEVDALQCLQSESTAALGAMMPSVLDQAFNGLL